MAVNGDSIQIGAPVVAGAKVTAEVVGHGRHDKSIVKMRRHKHTVNKVTVNGFRVENYWYFRLITGVIDMALKSRWFDENGRDSNPKC